MISRQIALVFICLSLAGCNLTESNENEVTSGVNIPDGVVTLFDFSEVPTSPSESNGVTLTADRFGKPNSAFHFNGKGSFLRVEHDINPEPVPELTLTLWVRPTGELVEDSFAVISHDDGDYDRTMGLDTRGEKGFGWSAFAGNKAVIGGEKATLNKWIMLTTVYDQPNKTVRLYLDNRQIAQSQNATLGNGNTYIHLGGNPGHGEHFQGDIDDVRIYHRALPEAEVQQLFNATKP